jgi:flagellar export protein FliJ
MTFRFRLEKLLHFVRLKETVKKMEIVSIRKQMDFLRRQKEGLEQTARGLLAGTALTYYQTTKIALDVKLAVSLQGQIEEANQHLEKKKAELNRLMMRKKGLESLREKKKHEFRTLAGRRQQRRLEDLHALKKVEES